MQSQNIALFPSTSYGFASALNNVKSHGGKAITIENEFPSGYFALEKWAISNQAEIIVVKRKEISLHKIGITLFWIQLMTQLMLYYYQ